MTARQFLTNIAIILAVMGIGALIETVVPMFAARTAMHGRRTANLGLTAVSFFSNWLLSSIAAAAALSLRPTGVLARLAWPLWLDIVVGIIVLDFSVGYVSHRTMHAWPAMWRFHRVHHSDDFVDVTTTYRTHPVETVWRFLFAIVPVWLLGIPAQAVLAFGIPPLAVMLHPVLQLPVLIFQHANVRLPPSVDRLLVWLIATPTMHVVHHSRWMPETNSNYANLLTIYDRVLGTYTPSERARSVVYGLDDDGRMSNASLSGLVALPFERAESGRLPLADRKVSVAMSAGR